MSDLDVAKRKNPQIPITLDSDAREEIQNLADFKGDPLATFCAAIIEDWLARRKSPEVPISLNPQAKVEIEEIANWEGVSLAALCAAILEDWHRSPSFKSLLDRVRKGDAIKNALQQIEAEVGAGNEDIKRLRRLLIGVNNDY